MLAIGKILGVDVADPDLAGRLRAYLDFVARTLHIDAGDPLLGSLVAADADPDAWLALSTGDGAGSSRLPVPAGGASVLLGDGS